MKKYPLLLFSLSLAVATYASTPESQKINSRQTGRFYIQPSLGLGVNNFSGHFVKGFVEGHFDSQATIINGEPIWLMKNPQRKQADFDLQSKLGFTGGIDVGYYLTSALSLSAGVWYQHQSCGLGQQTLFEPVYNNDNIWHNIHYAETIYIAGLDVRGSLSVDYLALPLLAHYQLWRGLSLTVGAEAALNLNTKLRVVGSYKGFKDEDNIYMEMNTDLSDMRNNIELRAVVGCSYEYRQLVLSLRYHHGLNKTAKGELNYFNSLTQQQEFGHSADLKYRSLQLTLGYRLNL
jgi:hypothetical protein